MSEEKVNEQKTAVCTWTKKHPHIVIGGLVLLAFALGLSLGGHFDRRGERFENERGYGKMMDRRGDDTWQNRGYGDRMGQNQNLPAQQTPTQPIPVAQDTQTPPTVDTQTQQVPTGTATGTQN